MQAPMTLIGDKNAITPYIKTLRQLIRNLSAATPFPPNIIFAM